MDQQDPWCSERVRIDGQEISALLGGDGWKTQRIIRPEDFESSTDFALLKNAIKASIKASTSQDPLDGSFNYYLLKALKEARKPLPSSPPFSPADFIKANEILEQDFEDQEDLRALKEAQEKAREKGSEPEVKVHDLKPQSTSSQEIEGEWWLRKSLRLHGKDLRIK